MTSSLLPSRAGRASGCLLVALLCILTTALLALADASAPSRGPARVGEMRVAIAQEADRPPPAAVLADRAMADPDNPFDDGRLPLTGSAVPVRVAALGRRSVSADEGPAGIGVPLPERPPRG